MEIVISNIRDALERASRLTGDVYLYGTGLCAKSVYYVLKKRMHRGAVRGFLQTKRTVEEVLGLPVLSVQEFSKITGDEVCVIIATQDRYREEITNTLRELGISGYCGLDWKELSADICNMDEAERELLWDAFPWYRRLQDAESRRVFTFAALAKLSCDIRYYLRMQKESVTSRRTEGDGDGGFTVADWVRSGRYLEERENFLYVPSWAVLNYLGMRYFELGISIRGICTDNVLMQETFWHGLPVVSLEKAASFGADVNILPGCGQRSLSYAALGKMRTLGFGEERILLPCGSDNPLQYGMQYFDVPELRLGEDEVFVDAGCYDCGTVQQFINQTQGRYRHIYSFEPDQASYGRCQNIGRAKKYHNFTLWNKGLWSGEAVLHFSNDGTALSKVSETGDVAVEVAALDELLKNEPVTMIKMDIEGAELEALKGCADIIRSRKPKLAISIYHKAADFVDIPAYLLSLVPEYKLYYRHYSLYKYETVLYAMV